MFHEQVYFSDTILKHVKASHSVATGCRHGREPVLGTGASAEVRK